MRWVPGEPHTFSAGDPGGAGGLCVPQPLWKPCWSCLITVARRGLESNCREDKGPNPGPQRDLWLVSSVRSNPCLRVAAGSPQANPLCVVEPQGKPSTAIMDTTPGHSLFWKISGEVHRKHARRPQCVSCGVLFTLTFG